MNLLDAIVVKVLSEPYEKYGKWFVNVKYDCWGSLSETPVLFQTEEQAKKLKEGDSILV